VCLFSARFVSEFGFQSLPSWETYSEVLDEEDWSPGSGLLSFRQRHEQGNEQME
jgi:beta-mannosidase